MGTSPADIRKALRRLSREMNKLADLSSLEPPSRSDIDAQVRVVKDALTKENTFRCQHPQYQHLAQLQHLVLPCPFAKRSKR